MIAMVGIVFGGFALVVYMVTRKMRTNSDYRPEGKIRWGSDS